MERQNMAASISAATIATSAQVIFGPILGATKPKNIPHGASTMNSVPIKLFQSVPAGRGHWGCYQVVMLLGTLLQVFMCTDG